MSWIFYLIALSAGAANPFQSGTNAELNKQLGRPLWAGVVVYATGLAGVLLLQAIFAGFSGGHSLPAWAKVRQIHWWAWMGGLISIASTMAGLTLAQKLGAGVFTGLSITAAVVTSVMLDQFGLIGFKQHSASPLRMVGCGLMIAGIWLVSRS
jgi:transporter family-2 protein